MTTGASMSVGTCSNMMPGSELGMQATALVQAIHEAAKQTAHVRMSASDLLIIARRCQFLAMSAMGVRRDKAALSSGCEPHPATAPAGSNRSSHGGNEVAEAFDYGINYAFVKKH